MVAVTGSDAVGGTNQTSVNNFNDAAFWFEWIEFNNNPANLTQAGFNIADGTLSPGTVVYNAGGTNNLNTLASDASAATLGNSGEQFGLRVVTTLNVTGGGNYTFSVNSDDGIRLYVDGVQVVVDDSLHAPRIATGTINLTPGLHNITIIYFENTGGNVLEVSLTGPDYPVSTPLQNAAVRANAGNDTIAAGAGNDVIDAGTGNDTIDGGAGNDSILGGAGNDLLTGGDGLDTISGGGDNDTISGGGGNDSLSGGAGADRILGGGGNDNIAGDDGADTIDGGVGNDTITGGLGNDSIDGNAGDDVIDGGDGNDTIQGDAGGNDPVLTRQSFEWDLIPDPNGGGNAGIDNNDPIASGTTQNTGLITVTVTNTPGPNFTGFVYNDSATQNVAGINSGAEVIDTTSAGRLTGTGQGDTSVTEFTFTSAAANVQNEVQNVQFRINDIDEIGFRDILTIRAFNAAGQPVIITLTPGANLTVSDTDGVPGTDTISINDGVGGASSSDLANSVLVTIPGPVARFEIDYGNLETAGQLIDVTDVFFDAVTITPNNVQGNDNISGGLGDDQIFGQGGNDTIDGGAGADLIDGGVGNDSLFGGTENDAIFGGTGTDNIDGGSGNDSIDGGADADTIAGGVGNDLVFGGTGADSIQGNDGNDTIDAGADNDTVDGGAGNDSIVGGTGADSIQGGTGSDTISGGDGNDTVDGGADNDSIDGGIGNDNLSGGTGNDTILGGTGNDAVFGGDGADLIDGGANNDTVDAGIGDDTIRASTGTDSVQGGDGTDTYTVPGASTIANNTETITVTVDANGDGTVVKTVNATTDTIGSVENFIASEAAAENDRLIYNTVVTDEGTITGLNGATGTFTSKNGDVVTFGGVGQPTFADVLAMDRTGQFIANGGSLTGTVGNIGFTDFETVQFNVVCFTRSTLIETDRGPVAIEALRVGDLVVTADHGLQPIRWIGSRRFDAGDLMANPNLRPITIGAGVLDNATDLTVSPQHRMLVCNAKNELYFGEPEVLIKAKDLLGRAGVSISQQQEVEYFHFLFDEHEIVFANGAASESLHPGAEALDTLSADSRAEILAIFPELCDLNAAGRRLARYTLKSYEARALAA